MKQYGLTVITRIKAGDKDLNDLKSLLRSIGENIDEKINGEEPPNFLGMSSVHFMRWVVIEDPTEQSEKTSAPSGRTKKKEERLAPMLAMSTNYDGALKDHLFEVIEQTGPWLEKIYSHCEDCPTKKNKEAWYQYLKQHARKNAAFYCGTVGRTVEQIRKESKLYDAIQHHLDTTNPSQNWEGQKPEEIHKSISEAILKDPEYKWAQEPFKGPFWYRASRYVLHPKIKLVAIGILILLFALIGLAFFLAPQVTGFILATLVTGIAVWIIQLRKHEAMDSRSFTPMKDNSDKLRWLTTREDFQVQNQLTHLVTIKPGLFRAFTVRFVLGAINLLARIFYNQGSLGGIPSIHFARWVIIDKGKRLLFFSNFGGSWESYLGDFIDKAAVGLTGVWSNTHDFPPTRWLIKSGARNSSAFKFWVRHQQIETQVWYTAYQSFSVQNINNNTRIREGLIEKPNKITSQEWLSRL